jgi:hypothetical protein
LQHCLKHAVNNLAQRPALTSSELDAIADRLAPNTAPLPFVHPHRTWVLGNWDVNVLECALRGLDKDLRWLDERDAGFLQADFAGCFGVVVNERAQGWSRLVGARHWFALRKLGAQPGVWLNLDSKLEAPQPVLLASGATPRSEAEQVAALREYLARRVAQCDAKVFIVLDMPEASGKPG